MFNHSNGNNNSRQKLFVLVSAIFLVIAMIVLSIFIFVAKPSTEDAISKEEAIKILNIIADDSDELESWINDVNKDKLNSDNVIYQTIDDAIERFNSIKKQCDKICDYTSIQLANDEQNARFSEIITEIKSRIDIYEPGIRMLSEFNVAFFKKVSEFRYGISDIDEADLNELMEWEPNEEAKKLLGSDNPKIKAAAEQLGNYIIEKTSEVKEFSDRSCMGINSESEKCLQLYRSLKVYKREVFENNFLGDIATGLNADAIIDYSAENYLSDLITRCITILGDD
jgi:hypothetical protein